MAALRAGVLYFLAVFALGFALGALRVLFIAPRVGELVAVCLELPVMLAFSWWICGRLARGLDGAGARIAMGALAFALLMAAEAALAIQGFGLTLAGWLAGLLTLPGKVGLAGQLAFALMPWLQRPRRQG